MFLTYPKLDVFVDISENHLKSIHRISAEMRCPGKLQAVGQAADKRREEFERLQETDLMDASSRFSILLLAKISDTYLGKL